MVPWHSCSLRQIGVLLPKSPSGTPRRRWKVWSAHIREGVFVNSAWVLIPLVYSVDMSAPLLSLFQILLHNSTVQDSCCNIAWWYCYLGIYGLDIKISPCWEHYCQRWLGNGCPMDPQTWSINKISSIKKWRRVQDHRAPNSKTPKFQGESWGLRWGSVPGLDITKPITTPPATTLSLINPAQSDFTSMTNRPP